jgi:hypothetical protein
MASLQSKEQIEQLDELSTRIQNAEIALKKKYLGASFSNGTFKVGDVSYFFGFEKIYTKDDKNEWCIWANQYDADKKIPVRELPVRVRVLLVNAGIFEAAEECLEEANTALRDDVQRAIDKLEVDGNVREEDEEDSEYDEHEEDNEEE